MNPTLYLSCLVVIVGSLAWTARAAPSQGDQTFNSEKTRLKNIYASDSADQLDRERNTPDLVTFYEKYGNQLQLSPEDRKQADDGLSQYKEELAKQPLVDGAPPQGVWWYLIPAGLQILTNVLSKALGA